LPFGRFPGVDTVLGPEMRATGEVMGIATDLGLALARAQSATGAALPAKGTVFVSVSNRDKRAIVFPAVPGGTGTTSEPPPRPSGCRASPRCRERSPRCGGSRPS
jgi:hypothetical protein